jgi:TPP-dependent pyruvate/acetoin dehydrogenase alpha subunit
MYRMMYLIRLFEEKAMQLYNEGINRGALHPYSGEEAIAAGVCLSLIEGDYITSTHRGHGHCLAMGGDPSKMLAELLGKKSGYCNGKGGSMHIADIGLGILGANGIVGGGIPISVGAGIALDNMDKKNVVVCFFGDGASNTGGFHESLNMASIWKLPIIFVCENNFYAISSNLKDSMNIFDISERARSYNIKGYSIDGNDVEIVYKTAKKARDLAVGRNGPVLIEAKTYRLYGHWIADPQIYRSVKEVNKWKKKDPILIFKEKLLEKKIVSIQEIKDIEKEIEEEISNAEKFAKSSPEPDLTDALKDVLV